MSVKIQFNSVSQRENIHRIIRESVREIFSATELLETLYFLENGKSRQDGFGYVDKNLPDFDVVKFYVSDNEFKTHLNTLKSSTIDDLDDDRYEKQLKSIINQLHEAAEVMEKNII